MRTLDNKTLNTFTPEELRKFMQKKSMQFSNAFPKLKLENVNEPSKKLHRPLSLRVMFYESFKAKLKNFPKLSRMQNKIEERGKVLAEIYLSDSN